MGITYRCKKDHSVDYDGTYSGIYRLRRHLVQALPSPAKEHFMELYPSAGTFFDERDDAWYTAYDRKTEEMIGKKLVSAKVVDFLYQPDCEGSIHYGACKQILALFEQLPDIEEISKECIGYAGRSDPMKIKDFLDLMRKCIESKCDLVWD